MDSYLSGNDRVCVNELIILPIPTLNNGRKSSARSVDTLNNQG